MMTLDEAIKHCEEVAEKNEKDIAYYTIQGDKEWLDECEKDYIECAKEHRQLVEWLTELQILRIITEYLRDSIGVFDTVDGKVGIETDIIEWAKEELTVKGVKADE